MYLYLPGGKHTRVPAEKHRTASPKTGTKYKRWKLTDPNQDRTFASSIGVKWISLFGQNASILTKTHTGCIASLKEQEKEQIQHLLNIFQEFLNFKCRHLRRSAIDKRENAQMKHSQKKQTNKQRPFSANSPVIL